MFGSVPCFGSSMSEPLSSVSSSRTKYLRGALEFSGGWVSSSPSTTTIRPGLRLGAGTRSRYASKTSRVVGPSTARHGPMPRAVMLESKVTFLPQFLGALPKARSPLRAQA